MSDRYNRFTFHPDLLFPAPTRLHREAFRHVAITREDYSLTFVCCDLPIILPVFHYFVRSPIDIMQMPLSEVFQSISQTINHFKHETTRIKTTVTSTLREGVERNQHSVYCVK